MHENMNMDYDVKLIDEVKKYPELYDSSHRNFKNKEIKAALWKDIAFKMRKQTDEYSVKVVRMRWKSLRDSYVKEIKYKMAVSTGHNVKPRKNWRYSNCMTFLAPYLAISFPLPPNKTEESKEELGDHEPEQQSFCMSMNSSNEDEANGHFLGALLDFSKHDNSEKVEISSRQEYVTSSTNTSTNTPNKSDDSDIDSFFKGISETVKKMNVVNQVFIQRNIVNMILDFKLREAQEKYIIQQRVADDND